MFMSRGVIAGSSSENSGNPFRVLVNFEMGTKKVEEKKKGKDKEEDGPKPAFQMTGEKVTVYGSELFENDPPGPLVCVVCLGVPFQDSVMRCGVCERVCCHPCHSRLYNKCPSCRNTNDDWNRGTTPSLVYMLDQLTIECPNECGQKIEKGGSSAMNLHLSTCPKQMGCCKACNKADMSYQEFEEHVESECPQRREVCGYCGDEVAHCRLGDHVRGCDKRPVKCVHTGCEAVVAQGDRKMHESKCEHRRVPCPLCDTTLKGDGLGSHLDYDKSGHVPALVELVEAMREEIATLRSTVGELQKRVGA